MYKIRMAVALVALAVVGCASAQMNSEGVVKSLAPSGVLRVAFLAGPLYATKDPDSGELRGVAIDVGHALSKRLGTGMQAKTYASPAALVAGGKAAEWDIALMGVNAERAAVFDFSPPYMEVEQGYLVRPGGAIATSAEVDRQGVRVGVVENTGADVLLSRTLKNATLVRAKSLQELESMLPSGNADVIAATKTFLFGRLNAMPGARMLEGNILVEPIAIALPRGRESAALKAVAEFVQDAKRSGIIIGAIEKAGLKGVVVAP